MTQEEMNAIDWKYGNTVKLTNGKEYFVIKARKNLLILYTNEYQKYFTVPSDFVDCRTSDKTYTRKKKKTVEKPKAVAPKKEETPVVPQKRKRQRIVKTVTERVTY